MRIGVNSLFLIPGQVGGTQTYLCETLLAMAARTDEQFVVFTNRENDSLFRELARSRSNISVHGLDFRAANRPRRVLHEQLWLPALVRRCQADVLWCPGYTAAAPCSCPQAVCIHDVQYKRHPEDFWAPARIATAALVRLAARRATRILTGSNFSRNEILAFLPVAPDSIHVVYYGVNAQFAKRLPEERLRHEVSGLLATEEPYLLSVANSYPHKNLPLLVRAFGLLQDKLPHSLVILGARARGERALQKAIRDLPHPERALRLDYLPRETTATLYQAAELVIQPSLYEGFGLPVLEAMTAGTPVLTTRCGAIPEVGGDCVRYFDPNDASDLAAGIRAMLEMSPDERRAWIRRAQARAGQFTWEHTADQTMNCFREAVAAWQRRVA